MAEWPTIPEGYGYPLVNMESRRLPDSVMEAIADSQELDDKITERIGEGGGEVVATPDATTTVKGKIRLAGDLAGTADAPTVPGLAQKLAIADAPELIRDIVASALVAGANVTITPNDEGDTITIGLSLGSAAQADVEDFAAATHTHAQSDVTGLVAALGAKVDASSLGTAAAADTEDFAAASHSHEIPQVTGLSAALGAKADTASLGSAAAADVEDFAPAAHTHVQSDVTGLTAALEAKLESVGVGDIDATGTPSASTYLRGDGTWAVPAGGGEGGGGANWGEIGGDLADQTDLKNALDAKADASSLGTAAAADVEDFAAATHAHDVSDVTGLTAALGAKADASSLGTAAASDVEDFAAAEHGHGISDVTGLQDALDGKASTSHTHTPSSIGAANAEHTHDIADVDGLQTALDGKQAADSDLSAIAALSSTGFVVRTGSGTAAARSIAGSGAVQVSNGNGASGNPTISVDAASTSAAGIVELATAAEAVDGSDTQRAVTPAGLAAKFIIDPVDESAYPDGTIFLYTE